ncbi:hypothetical protein FGG78_36300 [Thioclava sp. BHET1]|nr:hypothetical protein FGG78_36300 [Thioclava sp. BHET1]
MPLSALPQEPGQPGAAANCERHLTLVVAPAAMLSAQIVAPCDAGKRVVLNGNGLIFAAEMPVSGPLQLSIPAMSAQAVVSARFAQGAVLQASVAVPEVSLFDRVAVQWLGSDGFELHALEFGASYGSDGDVSATHRRSSSDAVLDRGGFLTVLGSTDVAQPLRAEIYTYPSGLASHGGKVTLALEAPVTEQNCGRSLMGETLRLQAGVGQHADLSVAMPPCGQGLEGQFLALNGLLAPLTIQMAAN